MHVPGDATEGKKKLLCRRGARDRQQEVLSPATSSPSLLREACCWIHVCCLLQAPTPRSPCSMCCSRGSRGSLGYALCIAEALRAAMQVIQAEERLCYKFTSRLLPYRTLPPPCRRACNKGPRYPGRLLRPAPAACWRALGGCCLSSKACPKAQKCIYILAAVLLEGQGHSLHHGSPSCSFFLLWP